jgi:hypothetical protein
VTSCVPNMRPEQRELGIFDPGVFPQPPRMSCVTSLTGTRSSGVIRGPRTLPQPVPTAPWLGSGSVWG